VYDCIDENNLSLTEMVAGIIPETLATHRLCCIDENITILTGLEAG